eukprot:TRINITY_DN34531_c0_g1_i1.p1 TRINITY_DN34531_c0_g1~~TRINITY_DN34531_c0_g1_i1.p1  ORF type:complete len:1442 (-),score=237.54 TRINITY_DN34531_c0_g1_i1:71-4072(-)
MAASPSPLQSMTCFGGDAEGEGASNLPQSQRIPQLPPGTTDQTAQSQSAWPSQQPAPQTATSSPRGPRAGGGAPAARNSPRNPTSFGGRSRCKSPRQPTAAAELADFQKPAAEYFEQRVTMGPGQLTQTMPRRRTHSALTNDNLVGQATPASTAPVTPAETSEGSPIRKSAGESVLANSLGSSVSQVDDALEVSTTRPRQSVLTVSASSEPEVSEGSLPKSSPRRRHSCWFVTAVVTAIVAAAAAAVRGVTVMDDDSSFGIPWSIGEVGSGFNMGSLGGRGGNSERSGGGNGTAPLEAFIAEQLQAHVGVVSAKVESHAQQIKHHDAQIKALLAEKQTLEPLVHMQTSTWICCAIGGVALLTIVAILAFALHRGRHGEGVAKHDASLNLLFPNAASAFRDAGSVVGGGGDEQEKPQISSVEKSRSPPESIYQLLEARCDRLRTLARQETDALAVFQATADPTEQTADLLQTWIWRLESTAKAEEEALPTLQSALLEKSAAVEAAKTAYREVESRCQRLETQLLERTTPSEELQAALSANDVSETTEALASRCGRLERALASETALRSEVEALASRCGLLETTLASGAALRPDFDALREVLESRCSRLESSLASELPRVQEIKAFEVKFEEALQVRCDRLEKTVGERIELLSKVNPSSAQKEGMTLGAQQQQPRSEQHLGLAENLTQDLQRLGQAEALCEQLQTTIEATFPRQDGGAELAENLCAPSQVGDTVQVAAPRHDDRELGKVEGATTEGHFLPESSAAEVELQLRNVTASLMLLQGTLKEKADVSEMHRTLFQMEERCMSRVQAPVLDCKRRCEELAAMQRSSIQLCEARCAQVEATLRALQADRMVTSTSSGHVDDSGVTDCLGASAKSIGSEGAVSDETRRPKVNAQWQKQVDSLSAAHTDLTSRFTILSEALREKVSKLAEERDAANASSRENQTIDNDNNLHVLHQDGVETSVEWSLRDKDFSAYTVGQSIRSPEFTLLGVAGFVLVMYPQGLDRQNMGFCSALLLGPDDLEVTSEVSIDGHTATSTKGWFPRVAPAHWSYRTVTVKTLQVTRRSEVAALQTQRQGPQRWVDGEMRIGSSVGHTTMAKLTENPVTFVAKANPMQGSAMPVNIAPTPTVPSTPIASARILEKQVAPQQVPTMQSPRQEPRQQPFQHQQHMLPISQVQHGGGAGIQAYTSGYTTPGHASGYATPGTPRLIAGSAVGAAGPPLIMQTVKAQLSAPILPQQQRVVSQSPQGPVVHQQMPATIGSGNVPGAHLTTAPQALPAQHAQPTHQTMPPQQTLHAQQAQQAQQVMPSAPMSLALQGQPFMKMGGSTQQSNQPSR